MTLPGPRVGFWLYLITDGAFEVRQGQHLVPTSLEGRLCSALAAVPRGTVAVQLRARQMEAGALLSAADRLRQLTARFGAPLLINDRLDVALLIGADGVHLPAAGLPPRAARRLAGTRLLLGSSTHTLAEARAAVADGVDFVTYGPIWPTPSKPALDVAAFPPVIASGVVSPVGVAGLAEAVAALPVPVFALGGVDCIERARECIAAGARIACLRAVLGAQDPAATARALLAVCSGEVDA